MAYFLSSVKVSLSGLRQGRLDLHRLGKEPVPKPINGSCLRILTPLQNPYRLKEATTREGTS